MHRGALPPRIPVILVHGYLSPAWFLWLLARRLRAAGIGVFGVKLSPLLVRDVRVLAAELDAEIDRILAAQHAGRCDVVAVSQGALVALWWMKHLGGATRVRRFVAVGAPFTGSWLAVAGLPVLGAVSAGIWQLVPGSPLLRELGGRAPEGVETITIALEGDPVVPPERCRLDGAESIVVRSRVLLGHQALVLVRPVAEAVIAALTRPRTDHDPGLSTRPSG